jgi:hypothetical protein
MAQAPLSQQTKRVSQPSKPELGKVVLMYKSDVKQSHKYAM